MNAHFLFTRCLLAAAAVLAMTLAPQGAERLLAAEPGPGASQASASSRPVVGPAPSPGVVTAVGIRVPSTEVSDLYGNPWPFTIDLQVPAWKRLFVMGGFGLVRKSGHTVPEVAGADAESFPLELSVRTLRVGGGVMSRATRRLSVFGGGGASFNWYREESSEIGFSESGTKTGFFLQAGVFYDIARHVSLVGRFEFAKLAPAAPAGLPSVNLGGADFSGGVRIAL